MTKVALITGVTGMVGSHMADFLLEKGYTVYGTTRDINTSKKDNILNIQDKINFLQVDINDQASLYKAVTQASPDKIYNFDEN